MSDKIVISKLFLDLDGCFCDFDKRAIELFDGKHPKDDLNLPDGKMWQRFARSSERGGFFDSLEWIPGSDALWDIVKNLNPTILTGVPFGKWAAPQKHSWVAREMGAEFTCITCLARDKQLHSGAGRLLIDDREKNILQWQAMGGETIHFKTPQQAIAELDRFDLSDCTSGY